MKKRKTISPSIIANIYILDQEGKYPYEIAKSLGINKNEFYRIRKIIKEYIDGTNKGKYSSNYKQALEIIDKHYQTEVTHETKPAIISIDPFDKLQEAEKNYQQAVSDFITEMVSLKIKKTLDENEQMKKVIEDSKHSSWVRELRRNLQGV